jgi:hypothetical protein
MQSPELSVRRIALSSTAILFLGGLSLMGSIWAVTPAPSEISGPMSDQVLEANNGGVPAAVVRRRAQVREAIELGSPAAWAGEYYEGDGLGANIELSLEPEAGIAATWHGCLGLYASNEGEVEERDDGALLFHFNLPNGESGAPTFGTFPTLLRPVRWGARRYLLSDVQMIEFVNAMHQGMEPRRGAHGLFLLATDDDKLPVSGLPDLPESVLASVRSTPLIVQVLSVESLERMGDIEFPECRARLRIRIPDGEFVVPGLEFEVTSPSDEYARFKVTDFFGTDALVEDDLFQDCADTEHLPTPEWKLSTGAYRQQ